MIQFQCDYNEGTHQRIIEQLSTAVRIRTSRATQTETVDKLIAAAAIREM